MGYRLQVLSFKSRTNLPLQPCNLKPVSSKNEQPAHDLRARLLPCTYEIQNYIRKPNASGWHCP
jgi:hypothetical protein